MRRPFLYLLTALLLSFPFPLRASDPADDILDLFRPGMDREEALERAGTRPRGGTADKLRFRLEWAARAWDVTLTLLRGKTAAVRWETGLEGGAARELRALLRRRGYVPAWHEDAERIDFFRLARRGMGKAARLRLFDARLDALLKAGETPGLTVLMPEDVFEACAGLDAPDRAAVLERHGRELFVLGIDRQGGRLFLTTAP